MAEPAQTPSPRPSKANPKIQFGQVVNIPARGLDGWTVRGMDTTSGRVVVSKRAGDDVDLRSVSLDEYEAAQKAVPKEKKKQAPPPPSFGLRQNISGEGVGVSVREYDAASNEALVEGTVDGKPIRRWMPRDEIEKVAREETPENLGKLKQALSSERPESKEQKLAAEEETVPEAEATTEAEELETQEDTEEAPVKAEDDIKQTREALREARTGAVPVTAATIVESVEKGAVKSKDVEDIVSRTDQRIEELKGKSDEELAPEEAQELEQLTEDKERIVAISEYADTVNKLENTRAEIEQLRARPVADASRINALQEQAVEFETLATSQRTAAVSAAGEIQVAIPQTATSGTVSAKIPGAATRTFEVQAQVPSATGREVEAEITAPGAGAPSIAAVAAVSSPQQVLQLAAAASTDLETKINQAGQTQKNIRAELETIGAQSARITGQMQEALQRGNEGLAGQLQTQVVDLNARRGDLQNRQIQTMTDMSGLRNVKNQIDTLSGNLRAAGESAPPELVRQLSGLVPQGFKMDVEAQAPDAALEEAATPRSYTAGVPAIPPPPPPASRAQGLRARLQSRLGIPFQTASAAALAGDGGRPPRGYVEGVGSDAREQALSYQGGAGEQAIPSYTQAPSAGEDEDVYTGAQSGRQRIRKIEREQRAAKEMLQPTEGAEGGYAEAEGLGAAPQEGAEAPGGRPVSGVESARAAGLAGQRGNAQAAYQRHLAALRGKHGALTGSIGGSDSNIEGLRRIKRFYDMVKAGTAITFVGLVITVLMMNASLINKYLIKSKYIPSQSFIEDLLTAWIDFNILLIGTLPFLIPLAIIAAVLGGAVAGIGGIASAVSGIFN